MKTLKELRNSLDEASSKQVHVRMDNLGKDQKKVGDILRKYEKNGSIEFDGETDKGAIFTVKKPAAIATLNRELKPYYTSAELDEAVDNDDKGEYDNEGEMAKTQLRGVVADASHMIKMFSDDQNLPEWVQAKITKAADYLKSAHSYMMNKDEKTDVEEMSTLTKIKAKLARGARGPSKKATPDMFRQTGKAGKKNQDRLQKAKTYELGRRARQK
jgi:hypothetical protein